MAVFGWEELGTNAVQMEMEPLRTEGVKKSREGGWTPRRTKNTGVGGGAQLGRGYLPRGSSRGSRGLA